MDNAPLSLPGWAVTFFEAMIAWMQNPPKRANPKGVWRFDKKVHPITFCPAELDVHLYNINTGTLKKLLRAHVCNRGGLPLFPATRDVAGSLKALEAEVNLYKRGSNSRNMQKGLRSKLKRLEAENAELERYKAGLMHATNRLEHMNTLTEIESAMRDAL